MVRFVGSSGWLRSGLVLTTLGMIAASGLAEASEDDSEPGRHQLMNYGRFLGATIKAPSPLDNNAMKGIAIKLGPVGAKPAAVCFDTDLLRVSSGWIGGFLKLRGTPFDGAQGTWPEVEGAPVFGTKPAGTSIAPRAVRSG